MAGGHSNLNGLVNSQQPVAHSSQDILLPCIRAIVVSQLPYPPVETFFNKLERIIRAVSQPVNDDVYIFIR